MMKNKMKKIMLLTTGGTIASRQEGQGLVPGMAGKNLLEMIPEIRELCEVEVKEILNLDSSNIQPEDWCLMAEETAKALESFDGVVISHGTDTMAYTSSALSWMLQNLKKPVILTGSQLPITDPLTDGKENLLDAFRTALTGTPGVYLVFGGKILKGSFARKLYTKRRDAFVSINQPDAGLVTKEEVLFQNPCDCQEQGNFYADTCLDTRVVYFQLYPGLDPFLIDSAITRGYRGIILGGFGSGNLPFFGRSLENVIKKAVNAGIFVYVISQCPYEGTDMMVYEVGQKAAALGCKSAGKMTPEALLTWLMWKLGHEK